MANSVILVEAGTHKIWRVWLQKNHLKENKVGLICHKKHTGKLFLTHREAMEDAICFGWIDTTIKRLDEDKYIRYFARRTDKSKWSDNTLSYAKRLLAEGLMMSEGIKRYNEGLSRPTHHAGIPNNPEMPVDLKNALSKNPVAKKNFYLFAQSYKRTYYRWILSAKLKETRDKRIKAVVQRALENKGKWG